MRLTPVLRERETKKGAPVGLNLAATAAQALARRRSAVRGYVDGSAPVHRALPALLCIPVRACDAVIVGLRMAFSSGLTGMTLPRNTAWPLLWVGRLRKKSRLPGGGAGVVEFEPASQKRERSWRTLSHDRAPSLDE